MHPHLTAVPGVPRIIDLSRFRNMGVLLLTCITRSAIIKLANRLISPEAGHLDNTGEVQRRQRLGGLLSYYYRAAA